MLSLCWGCFVHRDFGCKLLSEAFNGAMERELPVR
jgi:hypothetical protein